MVGSIPNGLTLEQSVGSNGRRAPARRRQARGVVGRQRLGRGVGDVAGRRVERGRAGGRRGVVAEDPRVGRVLPVGEGAAAAGVVVGGLDPLVLGGDDEAELAGPGRAGALVAGQVVHPALGLRRESHPVADVAEAVGAAGLLGEDAPVVEGVDEPRRPREVGEAVGLVRPLRIRHRVVAALAGARPEVDLAVLRPCRGALGRVVEVVWVAAVRVDRVEERHPLRHGDLELADPVAVADATDRAGRRVCPGARLRRTGRRRP